MSLCQEPRIDNSYCLIGYRRKYLLFFSLTHGSVPDFDEMFGHLPDKSDNSDSDFELDVTQQMLIFLSFKVARLDFFEGIPPKFKH